MITNELRIDLLLDQRKLLISEIKQLYNNISKIVVALIPILATLVASYMDIIDSQRSLIIRFVILDSMIILSMILSMCLFCANIKRDYISAIDIHLFNMYGITELFCNGQLSRKHTTGVKGIFPIMAIVTGFSIACAILLLMSYTIKHDFDFYKNHIYLLIILILQLLGFTIVIIMNLKRKVSQTSTITSDCLAYINRKDVTY